MSNYLRKHIPNFIVAVSLVILVFLAELICQSFVNEQGSQTLAKRWSKEGDYTELSVFFSENNNVTISQMEFIKRTLNTTLEESGVLPQGKERVAIDCFSSESTVDISSERTRNVNVRVLGVGGDFFLFHPYALLSGNYFSDDNDENEDAIILDETSAWLLFGSNDVAGKIVDVAGNAFVVRGVVRPEEGLFSKTVGEDKTTIYMNFLAFQKMQGGGANFPAESETGIEARIDNYELLVKNPVKTFGKNMLINVLGMEEDTYDLVENTTRYKVGTRLARLKEYFKLTMNTNVVTYPYWENRARGYDQLAALITFMQALFLIYPLIVLVCLLVKLYSMRHVVGDAIGDKKSQLEANYQRKKASKWLEKQKQKEAKEQEEINRINEEQQDATDK